MDESIQRLKYLYDNTAEPKDREALLKGIKALSNLDSNEIEKLSESS